MRRYGNEGWKKERMQEREESGRLIARCIVCRGNIHDGDRFELWEGGYYCERHSLPWLRERARQYAALLRQEAVVEQEQ